jgi:hypothetical protein
LQFAYKKAWGTVLGTAVQCAISREALDDHFGADALKGGAKIGAFPRNTSAIERLTRAKYLAWPVEEPNSVLVKTGDVVKLRKGATGERPVTGRTGSSS